MRVLPRGDGGGAMNKRELKANVLRGVRLLDKKDPLWWNGGEGVSKPAIEGMVGHIDLDKLDLSDADACVLGQRHVHHYTGGLDALGIYDGDGRYQHGFSPNFCDDSVAAASLLTELWAAVIQSRRFPRRKIARNPFCIAANKTWKRERA